LFLSGKWEVEPDVRELEGEVREAGWSFPPY